LSKIIFTGDIYQGKETCFEVDENLKAIFSSASSICGNFEGPIVNKYTPKDFKAGPILKQSKSVIKSLETCGFNTLSLANNHIFDYGRKGLEETLDNLEGFHCFGAGMNYCDAVNVCIQNINGVKVGYVSLTEWCFGISRKKDNNPGCGWVFDVLVKTDY